MSMGIQSLLATSSKVEEILLSSTKAVCSQTALGMYWPRSNSKLVYRLFSVKTVCDQFAGHKTLTVERLAHSESMWNMVDVNTRLPTKRRPYEAKIPADRSVTPVTLMKKLIPQH